MSVVAHTENQHTKRTPLSRFINDGARDQERLRNSEGTRDFQRLIKRMYRAEHAARDFLDRHHRGCKCGFCSYFAMHLVRHSQNGLVEILELIAVFAFEAARARSDLYGPIPLGVEPDFDKYPDEELDIEADDDEDTATDDDAV